MKAIWPKIALLLVCFGVLAFELWHLRGTSTPGSQSSETSAVKNQHGFVLLPDDQIEIWAKTFKPGSKVNGWEPTLGDMNEAEGALSQITALSKSDPDANRHIGNPAEYYRQYVAVTIDGKRRMFLNALCSVEPNVAWRKRLVVVMDGGNCFWHALYDPATERFSELAVNGRA